MPDLNVTEGSGFRGPKTQTQDCLVIIPADAPPFTSMTVLNNDYNRGVL